MVVVKTTVVRRWKVSDVMGIYRHSIPTTFNSPHYKLVTLCIHAVSAPLIISDTKVAINVPKKHSIAIDIV